eukprot:11211913-Lingulodinium_polyedra.AAC.1
MVRCLSVRDFANARLSDLNAADSQEAYDDAAASFGLYLPGRCCGRSNARCFQGCHWHIAGEALGGHAVAHAEE